GGARAARSGELLLRGAVGVGDQKRGEAHESAAREPRDEEHTVRRVLTVLDRRPERVQLREPRALLVGHQQADAFPPVLEPARELATQIVEPLAGARRHLNCPWEAVLQAA